MTTDYELKNIDSEDLEDLLVKVESSFNIKFIGDELVHITTFGELCDHIINKINLINTDDCTNQQAFYKLRNAISSTLQIDYKTISRNFALTDILPKQNRRKRIAALENSLGFNLNILRPPHWVSNLLLVLLLASFFGIFFYWKIGLLGSVFSILGLWLSQILGNELDLETVGQVAEKMVKENYLKSRRNSTTFNKREIEKILINWFSEDLDIDKSKLTRETKF